LTNLVSGLTQALPKLIPAAISMIKGFAGTITNNIGTIVDMGINLILSLVQGLVSSLPTLIQEVPRIINEFSSSIYAQLPKILQAGIKIIGMLVKGIISSIPTIIANLPQIILAIVNVVTLYNWASLGKSLITKLGEGIKGMSGNIGATAKGLAESAINAIKSIFTGGNNIGKNLIQGIWNGMSNMKQWVLDNITGLAKNIAGAFTGFFQMQSPSKLMALYGQYIAEGLAQGIDKNAGKPISSTNSLANSIATALQKVNDFVSNTVGIVKKEFQLWQLENEKLSGSSQELEMQLAAQQEQHNLLTEQIRITETALADIVSKYGESSTEALDYKNKLLDLQIAQAGLTNEIDATTAALNAQQDATSRKIANADSQSSSQRSTSRSSYNKEKNETYNENLSEIKDIARRNNVDLGVAQGMFEKNELDKIIGNVPKYASGTSYHPGGLAWVGELGKELINLPTGTQVYSNTESQKMSNQRPISLNIGTLVADDYGLKKLERLLANVRIGENARQGLTV